MISLLRDFTKSWIFTALMALLIASFAVFGLRDVFGSAGVNNVVVAGDRKVSAEEFKTQFDNYKTQQAQQNNGQSISNDDFVKSGLYLQMLDAVANQTAFSAWLDKLGVKATPKMVVQQIAQISAFFNPVTGRFDKDTYHQALAMRQMNQAQFEKDTADQLAVQQYSQAALSGVRAPRILAALEAAYELQSRDARVFTLSPNNVDHPTPPSDKALQDYYNSRKEQLSLPELRTASIVRFSASDYAKSVTATDADLKALYDKELPTLKTAETRSFTEISAPDAASANAIAADLKAGKSPADAAKAHKGNVIPFTDKAQSDIPDAKIAAAAFALPKGQVSGAVQGDLGYAVIRMDDVKGGGTPSFDSVRAKLADDYRQNKAADMVNDLVHKFQDARDAGDDFTATAAKLNLKVAQLPPMSAQGKTGNTQVDYSQYPDVVKAIFDLGAVGAASDVTRLADGEYFALKLDAIKPAGPPPLDEIKPELAQYYMMEKMSEAVQKKAEEAKARLDKGEDFAKVAASYNAPVQTLNGLDRAKARQSNIPDALASRIFAGQAGDSFQTVADKSGLVYALGRIDAIHQADAGAANTMAANARLQMGQLISRDVASVTETAARDLVKTRTYPATAAQALGVTPPTAKADKTDKKAKS
ncbi:MAG TPA: peptidyl-prolyl cis-trans isomerase [Asticcacaulis sp.]|nr:peptidyl-prolyl cis-trans isomerase [Asticcacaulis sp.]